MSARRLCAVVVLAGCVLAGGAVASDAVAGDEGAAGERAARVDRVAIRGNHVVRSEALQAAAAPFTGRELTGDDVEALCAALTRLYADLGYFNSRVTVDGDAPLHDGVLGLRAVEGRITAIRVQGLQGLPVSYVIDRLRGAEDEVPSADQLRWRMQLLSEDPLFARVNSRIEAGADPADAILDVDVQMAMPYTVTLALDNYRPPEIGEKAYDVSGQLRDLTGHGDLVDTDLSGPVGRGGQLGYAADWQLPFGHDGATASLSAARINTVLTAEPLALFGIASTIEREEARIAAPLWRAAHESLNLGASIAHEQQSISGNELFALLGGLAGQSTRSSMARLMPEYTWRTERQYFGVRATLLHAYLLDYTQAGSAGTQPDQQYFLWNVQVHDLAQLPGAPFEIESRLNLQRTRASLASLHQMAIGGVNSVRGYRENDLLVDDGLNLNLDVRWLALRVADGARPAVNVGTFFDWADGHDIGAPADTYSSCGLTLRLKWTHVQGDLAYGVPLIHPGFTSLERGSWQDHGIHVQIALTL